MDEDELLVKHKSWERLQFKTHKSFLPQPQKVHPLREKQNDSPSDK